MRQSLWHLAGIPLMLVRAVFLATCALQVSVSAFNCRNAPVHKLNLLRPSSRTFEAFKFGSLTGRLPMTYEVKEMEPTTTAKRQSTKAKEEDVPKTLGVALRVFLFSSYSVGPTTVALILAVLFPWRLAMSPLTAVDWVVFFSTMTFWFFQEHFLHGKMLHSEFDWYGKTVHEGHHDKPYFHISIDPAPLMLAWMATAHAIFQFLLPLPLACTATLAYASAGLFYEWSHFIVHTQVKPTNTFMKRMRDNHIRHHCVDKRYWLGFSLPAIDTILGTNPDVNVIRRRNKQEKKLKAASSRAEG